MRIHAIFGGIGALAVKFRWFVIAVWLIAAFAVPRFLPSLPAPAPRAAYGPLS